MWILHRDISLDSSTRNRVYSVDATSLYVGGEMSESDNLKVDFSPPLEDTFAPLLL